MCQEFSLRVKVKETTFNEQLKMFIQRSPCNFRHTLCHKQNKQLLLFYSELSYLLVLLATSSKSLIIDSGGR